MTAWPHFDDDEIEAAVRVLRSGRVNQWTGEEVRRFEDEFARAVGARHAVALANGTVAIELALRALGVGPGDDVVVPSRTFVATASAVVAVGARPVVADVDRDSGNLTAATLDAAITPRARAVLPVHVAGWPCDMDAIGHVARARGLLVVEDCAQALGARWRGRAAGTFGDAAAFSFCQDKILSTGGEGGMLVTDDEATFRRAWSYKDHGKDYDEANRKGAPPGFRWLHADFGTNWRLTEMQAAIGRVQLRKLPRWLDARRRNAIALLGALAGTALLRVPLPPPEAAHAWYKAYAYVRRDRLAPGWDRQRVLDELARAGGPAFTGSCSEIYREAAFARHGYAPPERLPNASELMETSLMFNVHPTLGLEDVAATAKIVREVLDRAAA